MSTYYYVCCEVHRLAGPIVAGRSFPDRWWSEDWDAEFVRDHQGCAGNRGGVTLTIRSEHQIEDFSRQSMTESLPPRGVASERRVRVTTSTPSLLEELAREASGDAADAGPEGWFATVEDALWGAV
jgi:hypothetical protein